MKINFTKKEYRVLVEMLLTADWVITAHEDEPSKANKDYADLRKKVLSHYKEMGMEDLFQYNAEHDEYYETKAYEDNSVHMAFIDQYNELTFWNELADKMAKKALAAERMHDPEGEDAQMQRAMRVFELVEHFEEEFAEHGLDHVRIEMKGEVH